MNFVLVTRVGWRELLHPHVYGEKLPSKVRFFYYDYTHDCAWRLEQSEVNWGNLLS